jgi:hypothetical protein
VGGRREGVFDAERRRRHPSQGVAGAGGRAAGGRDRSRRRAVAITARRPGARRHGNLFDSTQIRAPCARRQAAPFFAASGTHGLWRCSSAYVAGARRFAPGGSRSGSAPHFAAVAYGHPFAPHKSLRVYCCLFRRYGQAVRAGTPASRHPCASCLPVLVSSSAITFP